MIALALSSLRRWLRLAPGPDPLARWPVDEATWTAFLAMERRREDLPNELPMPDTVPAGGLEVIAETDGLWLAGRRVALPLRGNPEILEARLVDGDPVATLEMRLKTASRVNSSGAILAPEFSRLSVPVPGPAWREARRAEAHFNRDTPGKPDFFHGPGDGSDPEDLSTCPACGFQTHKFRSQCERCGMGLQSRRWSRRFGATLIVCGLILTALMGGVLRFVGPTLYQVVVYGDSARFNGTRTQAVVVLTLLGGVFLFGVLCLAYGGWQVATGRAHLRGARAIAKFFGVIMALAILILWLK